MTGMAPRILVITGASGSGKTAIIGRLAGQPEPGVRYHHFDSVGVPSPEEMERDYGSGEGWQTAVTREWIARLARDGSAGLHVLEGQVRPAMVQQAFVANGVYQGQLLLLDCSPEIRTARLHGPRGQPELASAQMMAWSAYLRGQADALGIPVLDTTDLSLDQAGSEVEKHIRSLTMGASPTRIGAELEIRDLPPQDFHLMWPTFHAVVSAGDTYSLDPNTTFEAACRLWTTPPSRAFLALKNGAVAGGYVLRPARDGLGDHVANAGYMVSPDARGQGIAQQLCEHSLDMARRAGYQAMQFHYVVASNEAAVRAWQRCGFAIVGRAPKTFRHPRLGLVDTLIMHRYLEP